MSGELLLGLDVGTTRACALLVDAQGVVRARAERTLGVRFPAPGHVEQDPAELFDAAVSVLRELVEAAGGASRCAALGVASQRATALAWDARSGRPLAPAIGWQDQRTAARAAELHARGVPIPAQASATKLGWLLEHVDAVAEAAREGRLRLGTPDAWLTDRLTGGAAFVTDPGCASATALFDVRAGGWLEAVAALLGVPVECLPRVAATAEVVGATPAALLGDPVPVAARVGDQQAACFAQGVHAEGDAKLTLGTAAMLDVHTGRKLRRGAPGTHALALWRLPGAEDALCLEASVFAAGAAVDWLVAAGLLPDAASLEQVACGAEGPEGVAFVPALQGLGAPWNDDAARGLLGGLTRGTTAAHVARATIEGIAQRCADLCDAVELAAGAELRVDGGLTRSRLLLHALADATGRTVRPAPEPDTTALGAAQLAGLAVGMHRDLADCRRGSTSGEPVEPALPDAARAAARERWHERVARARGDGGPP